MNKTFLSRHLLIAVSLCCLNSCIYSDLGRTIGSIGTEIPRIVPKATTPQKKDVYIGRLYRMGQRYFVELPMVWVPERRKGFEYRPVLTISKDTWNSIETYNRPYTAIELHQYTPTPIYFEATKLYTGHDPFGKDFITRFKQRDKYGALGIVSAELQPATDFDPKKAENLGPYGIDGAPNCIGHLEKRHTAVYTYLLPVQMVARVIDIPLSLVLMPLSTPIIISAYEADWEWAVPYWDYSRPCSIPVLPLYPNKKETN